MRILFVTARLPLPNTKGDALRSFHFIRDLSTEHDVDVVSFTDGRAEREGVGELAKHCRSVTTIRLPRWWAVVKMLLGIFSLVPFQVIYYSSLRMHLALRKAVRERRYDLVHVSPVRMMSYRACFHGVPLVVDLVDALSLNMRRRAFREKRLAKRLAFHFEGWKMARYEAWVTQQYDYGTITSDVDRRAIRGNHLSVVPNGVDTVRFRPSGAPKEIDSIFTGNMGYFPNVDAAVRFAETILPEVRAHKDDFTFYVVGANPTRKLRDIQDRRSTFVTGFVPDVAEYLNRAKVFVAPLSVGSGIQNKILEAMACGVPVVSTRRGNAAIDAGEDEAILIAETPGEFAEKVLALMADPIYRDRIGRAGREHARARFAWRAQTEKLLATYEKAIQLHAMKEYERSTGRVPIYYYKRSRLGVQESDALPLREESLVSRAADVILAAIGVALTLPLSAAVAVGIKLTGGGPILFRQYRVGKGGRPFELFKFRTMVPDAESDGRPKFAEADDPRVTLFGKILRKTRVDELPQFLNVLRGDMSLIGPRPERPEFVCDFDRCIPLYGKRHAVKPGLTGWAQVKFPYAATIEDTARKLQYDLYYIKNRSAWLDAGILVRTIGVVLTGKGAR
jgi:sugar transferase (PEP-CTERM/EpsH1 system associated)